MKPRALRHLAAVYAVGALDGDDLVQFEAHLAGGCDRCADDAARIRTRRWPGWRWPSTRGDAAGRGQGRAAARVADGAAARRAPSGASWVPWAAATGAAAMVASAMLTGGFVASRYEAQLGEMAREVSRIRDERLRAPRRHAAEQIARVPPRASSSCAIPPRGWSSCAAPGRAAEATGRVVWHEHGRRLPLRRPTCRRLPAGKAYEAWTLGGPAPRPAGVFTVDASGRDAA